MEPEKLEHLIERFYAGETSREEEALLQTLFQEADVPQEWAAEKRHFELLKQWRSEQVLGEAFDEKIMERLNAGTPTAERSFSLWYALAGVAATVLLLLALWMGNRQDRKSALPGTTQNMTLAYVQAKTALEMISGNLHQGLQPVSTAASEMGGAMNEVSKLQSMETAVKPLRKLSEIERAQQLMQSLNSVYVNLKPLKNNR